LDFCQGIHGLGQVVWLCRLLSAKSEFARFKDLGEIGSREFAQFIGKQIRLSKVEYAPRAESGPIFNFYMGKNTPERKDYIMDKLVVPVEE